MTDRRTPSIASRKRPKQARSNDLVAAVLEAATQVLATEGAHRFTTARVAAKAGVSIGSLYQYFPNKAAILFRLQTDEWQQTSGRLRAILEDQRVPPPARLRALVQTFVRSECEEAAMRLALGDAAPFYRDAPEARTARHAGDSIFETFLAEALPDVAETRRTVAADLIATTLGGAGKQFSETPRSPEAIVAFASAMAGMFCAYLGELDAGEGGRWRDGRKAG